MRWQVELAPAQAASAAFLGDHGHFRIFCGRGPARLTTPHPSSRQNPFKVGGDLG